MSIKEIEELMEEMSTDSETIMDIIYKEVGKYSKELDKYVYQVQDKINKGEKFADEEIEEVVLKVPVYLYFAVEGLEKLGVDLDISKGILAEKSNNAYLETDGTVEARKRTAELESFNEEIMTSVYNRAYKLLNARISKAESIYSGFKKIYDKRIREMDANILDKKYKDLSGANHIDDK